MTRRAPPGRLSAFAVLSFPIDDALNEPLPAAPGSSCLSCGSEIPGSVASRGLCPACLASRTVDDSTPTSVPESPPGPPLRAFGEAAPDGARLLGSRYRIRSLLGQGGMGEVWRAEDTKLGVDVALKLIRTSLASDPRLLEMLRQEVRLARSVISLNVCRVYDLVELEGRELVSMEYVDGRTLDSILRSDGPLDFARACDIAGQFLAGLQAIHFAGLVHRDVKPENVMITAAGRLVVMDFGLAKPTLDGATGSIAGTPGYMPPEQARGEALDARADVYAAGVTLAEIVSPVGLRSPEERRAVWAGARDDPPRFAETPWAPVLRRAVAFDRRERYANATELARALDASGAGGGGGGSFEIRASPARRDVSGGGRHDPSAAPLIASNDVPHSGQQTSSARLPRPASSFVGREREKAEISALLTAGARFLTLTGPGGSGKTRLAIEVAAAVAPHFAEGSYWVGLSSLRDTSLVAETIARALGVKGDRGLAAELADRQVLLLVDNLEQVIGAAPQLAALVESCPRLSLLVTSRELLRVRGEVEYSVPPLDDREAVELFCARSRLEPDDMVERLCRQLDNLPLAVELAAARTVALTPAQILERLSRRLDLLKGGRDSEARQQTLRNTIAWSFDLLSTGEQRLFRRLSVFAGGCELEATERICAADLDSLQSLVEKNLLRFDRRRYRMLETIRDFAAEQLAAAGEAEALGLTHAEYFVSLAEEAEPTLLGTRPDASLKLLERDRDNLRLALDELERRGETQMALRLGGAIWEWWCIRGRVLEGWRRLEALLALDDRPTPARAKALTGATHLASAAGASVRAHRLRAEQALALYRELGDEWGIAYAEFQLAEVLPEEGELEAGRNLLQDAELRLRTVGDEHRALQAAFALGLCRLELGEGGSVRRLFDDLLAAARSSGDRQMEARALAQLARLATDEARLEEAAELLRDAYRLDREIGDPIDVASDLVSLARVLAASRRPEAASLLSSAAAQRSELGFRYPKWIERTPAELESQLRATLDPQLVLAAWERGSALDADEAVALAFAVLGAAPGSPRPADS